MLHPDLLDSARAISDKIVTLRRAIHAEPELGLDTPKTLAKVKAALAHLPLEWREGGSTTGAVATLKGSKPGTDGHRRVLLRGDMDALPMDEHTGLDFASTTPGRMHSCGHDTHTAMLAGAAELLCARRESLAGEVQFMFQPGEEGFHGAKHMLADGLISPMPEAAFALHIMPNSRHGIVAGRAGALMASADQLDVRRDVTRHLAFSSGPHFCIGSHLARLQARVALEELLAAHPRVEVDPAAGVRHPSAFVRAWHSLPVARLD